MLPVRNVGGFAPLSAFGEVVHIEKKGDQGRPNQCRTSLSGIDGFFPSQFQTV